MAENPSGASKARVTAPEGWVPAFEGQRPPFAEGNTLAVKHGAGSPRQRDPIAQALAVELLSDPEVAYLRAPRYMAAVQGWAQAEAKCALIAEWVDGMPIEQAASSKQGQTSPLELLRKWEATAQTHRARLGLDPLSASKLGRNAAATQVDIARLMAELHESEGPRR